MMESPMEKPEDKLEEIKVIAQPRSTCAVAVDADRKPLMELCARACVSRMVVV